MTALDYWGVVLCINCGFGIYEGERVNNDERADDEMGRETPWQERGYWWRGSVLDGAVRVRDGDTVDNC